MTVAEAIKKALRNRDVKLAEAVARHLQTYESMMVMVEYVGVDRDAWEELLAEV